MIKHDGIIKNIDNQTIEISIIAMASCASCQIKGVCTSSDVQEKIIKIETTSELSYQIGDKITVEMSEQQGNIAVLWAYVLPLILMILSLIVSSILLSNETLIGLLGIGVLLPYYSILYLLRNKIRNQFNFYIIKN
jgi:sigma-E factor negative regulatory protein RseC